MSMSVTMALFDGDLRDELFTLMELAEIKNYTHFVGLQGSSNHGKKEGSVAWPGSNEILLLILSVEERARFKAQVERYKKERTPSPGLLTFSWELLDIA